MLLLSHGTVEFLSQILKLENIGRHSGGKEAPLIMVGDPHHESDGDANNAVSLNLQRVCGLAIIPISLMRGLTH